MSTNSFFNNFDATNEQSLLEGLVVESIKIYGQDMIYLPRHNIDYDPLYGTSDLVKFKDTFDIEMYIKSVDGFGGDGNFLSKFGLEIRDQVTFSVAKKTFDEYIKANSNLIRPREGDLVYFPLNKKLFEIKYADNKPTFYQLGALQLYNLTCELYEYSSEVFETGIEEIDIIQKKYTQNILETAMLDENGTPIEDENGDIIEVDVSFAGDGLDHNPNDDSNQIQKETDQFINWSEKNPFSERGSF